VNFYHRDKIAELAGRWLEALEAIPEGERPQWSPEYEAFLKRLKGKTLKDFDIREEPHPAGFRQKYYRAYLGKELIGGAESMEAVRREIDKVLQRAAEIDPPSNPHSSNPGYHEPANVPEALGSSMSEETTAADWYRRRAEYSEGEGDKKSAGLWRHVAGEEDTHYTEFQERLEQLKGQTQSSPDFPGVTTITSQNKAVHVTSDPRPVIKALKAGSDLSQTRGEGLVGDLGSSGLYFSDNPQVWVGRATAKWSFLDTLTPQQLEGLSDNLLKEIKEQRGVGYISQVEYEYALRDIGYVKTGDFAPTALVMAANQPYNIPFWKQSYLDEIGAKQTKPPIEVVITLEGRFADVTNYKGNPGELVEKLKSQGYDGMIHRGSWGMHEQGVVWNPRAVKEFAGERY
jgi:rubrerythrin